MGQTKLIKQILNIQLLHEKLQNMYIVTDGIHYSLWMGEAEKDDLLALTDSEFVIECEKILEEQEY